LRRYKKWLLRFVFYVIFGMAILGVLFYLFPLSGKRLNDYFSSMLSASMDAKVEAKGVRLYLSRGLATINKIAIAPPDEEHQEILLRNIKITFPPKKIRSLDAGAIREIRLNCPMHIPLIWSNGRLDIDKRFDHLLGILSKLSAVKSDKRPSSIPRIGVTLDAIPLYTASKKGKISGRPILSLRPIQLWFYDEPGMNTRMTMKGTIRTEVVGEMEGFMVFSPDKKPQRFVALFSHILMGNYTFPMKGIQMDVKNLRIESDTAISNRYLIFDSILDTDAVSLRLPGIAGAFREPSLRVETHGILDFVLGRLKLDPASIVIGDSFLNIRSETALHQDMPFNLTLEQTPISRLILERIKGLFLPPRMDMAIQRESLSLVLNAEGSLKNLQEIKIEGRVPFKNIAIRHQDFPLPLTELSGVFQINNTNASFTDVRGKFGDGKFQVSGKISGAPDISQPKSAELSWGADLSVGDIDLMLGHAGLPEELEISGWINTTGTLEMALPQNGVPASCKTFHALAEIRDCSFIHPILPEPLFISTGKMDMRPQLMELREVQGRLANASFKIDGLLTGEPRFWTQPNASLAIEGKGDIETVIPFLPDRLRLAVLEGALKGRARGSLNLKGPLLNPFEMIPSGEIALDDFSFNPGLSPKPIRLEEGAAVFQFAPGYLNLETLKAKYADMPFQLNGKMAGGKYTARLDGFFDLGKLLDVFPALKEDFSASGTIELGLEATFASANLRKAFYQMIQPDETRYGFRGEIQARGAGFAYVDMPAALKNINGTILFTKHGLSFDNIKLDCGQSLNGIGSGKIDFNSAPPVVDFNVRLPKFFLEEWTLGWVSTKHNRRFITMQDIDFTSPTIEVRGDIMSDELVYQRLEGTDFHGKFLYNFFPHAPNKFIFEKASVNAYGGSLSGTGSLLFPTGPFTYGVKGEVKDLSLQPAITALRNEDEKFTGILTGTASLAGVARNPDTIRGEAEFDVRESRLIGNMIMEGLGKALNSTMFNDISFTRIQGEMEIRDGGAHFKDVHFTSPLMNLNASGSVDFNEQTDIICYLIFSRNTFMSFPILRQIRDVLETLGKYIFKYHITGTLKKPHIQAVPLSGDELIKRLPGF